MESFMITKRSANHQMIETECVEPSRLLSSGRPLRVCVVFSLFLVSIRVWAADDAGWNKARWGMTTQQVAQAYPEARPLSKPETYKPQGQSFTATLGIERFELAAAIYSVRFLMDGSNTLAGVILRRHHTNTLAAEYDILTILLSQKYGQPSLTTNDADFGTGPSVTWTPPGVSITLSHITLPSIRSFDITLMYLRANKPLLEKL